MRRPGSAGWGRSCRIPSASVCSASATSDTSCTGAAGTFASPSTPSQCSRGSAANDRLFAALVETVGLPELASDSRFATNADRVANRAGLTPLLEERFATEDRATWIARLGEAKVPAAPVQDVSEVAAAEQTEALGILQELPHATVEGLRLAAFPVSFDGERVEHRSAPPGLGEHTREILAEAGYSSDEIEALLAAGSVA